MPGAQLFAFATQQAMKMCAGGDIKSSDKQLVPTQFDSKRRVEPIRQLDTGLTYVDNQKNQFSRGDDYIGHKPHRPQHAPYRLYIMSISATY